MAKARIKLKRLGARLNGVLLRKSFSSLAEGRKWQRSIKELQDQIRSGSKKYLEPILLTVQAQEFLKGRQGMASFGHQKTWMEKYIISRPESHGKLLHECTKIFWKEIFGERGELLQKYHLNPATHNRVRAMIHKLYEEARRDYEPPRATDNPIHDIEPLGETDADPVYLDRKEDVFKYIEASQEERFHPGWPIYVAIKLNTGLRQQNIIPLRWKDDEGTKLRVREKFVRTKTFTGFLPGTKSGQKERSIGINSALRSALDRWKHSTPHRNPEDFIAVNAEGSFLTQKQIWFCNRRTLKRAELPYLSEHKLRHTYATHYLDAGGNIHDLKLNLFHAAVSTTEMYSHALESSLTKRAEVFQVPMPPLKKEGK